MEKLENKYKNLFKAYTQLSQIIDKYTNPPTYADEEDIEIYITALLKRFELTFEMLWKFLKQRLKNAGVETIGSKDVIKNAFVFNILLEQEDQILLKIVDARNEIAHNYDEEVAKALCQKVVNEYYPVLSQIIPRLEPLIKK